MATPTGCPNRGCQARHTAQRPFDVARLPKGTDLMPREGFDLFHCGNCGLVYERSPEWAVGAWHGWYDSFLQGLGWTALKDTQ